MKGKGRSFLILLLISIAVRAIFYFFSFEDTFLYWIGETDLLYDVIFFAILINLMQVIKERKWLSGMAWVVLIDAIAHCFLEIIHDHSFLLTERQYILYFNITSIPPSIFYICIFFARKNPTRLWFRCMTAVTFILFIYMFCTPIFHLRDVNSLIPERTQIMLISTVINLLLIIAVLKTPELRQPQYADFMED